MSFDVVMNYVECDFDTSLTLPEWRHIRAGARPRRRHRVSRLGRVRLRSSGA